MELKVLSTLRLSLYGLSFGAGIILSFVNNGLAVAPAPITPDADVQWSQIVRDRFDGAVVYDKNFDGGSFTFISSWAPQGIRATYTQYHADVVGYRTVWKSKWVKHRGNRQEVRYPEQEPIYRRYSTTKTPRAIKFAINDQTFTYTDGPVSPELAAALRSAPNENMIIRLIWTDESTTDMPIGRGTVATWKTLFASVTAPSAAPLAPVKSEDSTLPLIVKLNPQGQVFLGDEVITMTHLTNRVQQYLQAVPQGTVILEADKQASYQRVTETLELLKSLGRDRVQLSVQ